MNPLQLLQMLPQLQQNPAAFLQQKMGVQLPEGMNDPNAILKWMVDNGKTSQAQIDQLKQTLSSFGINR